MHSASPGATGAVIVQTQFTHLCICKNLSVTLTGDRRLDSIMRQRLTDIYFFLWCLSCLLYLPARECTWKPGGRALTRRLLHCSGGCHQKHLLFELQWQWGKVGRGLIRTDKVHTHDPVQELQFLFLSFLCSCLLQICRLWKRGYFFLGTFILPSIVGLPYRTKRNNKNNNNNNDTMLS